MSFRSYEQIEGDLDREIIDGLLHMLYQHNPLVQKFRMARDCLKEEGKMWVLGLLVLLRVILSSIICRPLMISLCWMLVIFLDTYKHDIIVHCANDKLKRISSLHPALMALQYPLLFSYGERGFQVGVPYIDVDHTKKKTRQKMTMADF